LNESEVKILTDKAMINAAKYIKEVQYVANGSNQEKQFLAIAKEKGIVVTELPKISKVKCVACESGDCIKASEHKALFTNANESLGSRIALGKLNPNHDEQGRFTFRSLSIPSVNPKEFDTVLIAEQKYVATLPPDKQIFTPESLPVEKVPFEQVRGTQDYGVDPKEVENYRKEFKDNGDFSKHPAAIEYKGLYYIADGHHRAEAAFQEGASSINMHVEHIKTSAYASLAKAENKDLRDSLIKDINDVLDKSWESLPKDIQDQLISTVTYQTSVAFGQLNITDEGLLSEANMQAADWARNRAAEMVGKKWVDGVLVDNPNAEWVISDTTREGIRDLVTRTFEGPTPIETLIENLMSANEFSYPRAENIARTEVKNAATEAHWQAWETSNLVEEVSWLISSLGDVCQLCIGYHNESPFPFNKAPRPVRDSHPQCRCSIVATKLKDNAA